MKLLIATNNQHKVREIREMFDAALPGKIELLTLKDALKEPVEVEETGSTFEENACLKAKSYFELTKIPCFADDSGLEVDILKGEPGIYSARYAGVQGEHPANRQKVLNLLGDIPLEQRTARFRAVICYEDGRQSHTMEGSVEGKIIFEEKGSGGFGYDPIFVPDEYLEDSEFTGKTFAEIPAQDKHRISHRGRAVQKLISILKQNI